MANDIKIRLSTEGAAAVTSDFRAVAAEVGKMGNTIDKALKPQLIATEAAFRQLGLGGSKVFQDLAKAAESDRIKAAFATIQKSSFATVAEVDRASKAMQASLQGLNQAGTKFGPGIAAGATQAGAALQTLGHTAKDVFTIFTGFAIGSLFLQGIERIKAFATETAKLGLEAKVQEDAFERLSQSVGVAGDALVAEMQKASGGILNTSDVMIAAAKALNQSLQPEQIVNLMTIARQQSKLAGIDVSEAFNQITQAIANQQPRALKQLGIVVDMDAAFKKHAATLGVEVERLNELGKTQAIYNAVAEQTKNSVKALTDEGLSQSEMVQKMAGQWKQVKEDIGKFVVDAGFAVLAWFSDVGKRIPDLTAATQQMGQIWSGVWGNLKLALAGIGENLVSVIIPSLKLALAAAAAFGVGLNVAFAATAGPAAFLSSVIGDLADKKWPNFAQATREANLATAEARVRLAESIEGFQKLKDGTAATSAATKDMAGAAVMGANKLADVSNQIKPLIPDLKALQSAVAGIAGAFKALSDEASRGVFPEDEFTKINAPLDAFRDKMREQLATLGLSKDAIQKLDATLAGLQGRLVEQVIAFRDAKEEAKTYYAGLHDGSMSAAQSVEAGQDALEGIVAAAKAFSDARVADMLASMAMAMKDVADLPEVAKLTSDLVALNREVMALKAPTDLDAESIKRFGVAFDLLDEATKKTLVDMRALKQEGAGTSFANDLNQIGVAAQLLGPNFDAAGATISRMQQRLKELSDAAHGEITPSMLELAASINGLIDESRLKDALGLTRTTFDDLVDAARSTAQNMNTAFSDLFFDAFTGNLKSAFDVFKGFALSMLRVLSDFLAQTVVKKFLFFLTAESATPGSAAAIAAAGGANADPGGGSDSSGLQTGLSSAGSGIRGIQSISSLSTAWDLLSDAWSGATFAIENSTGIIDTFSNVISTLGSDVSAAASGVDIGLSGVGLALGYVGAAVSAVLTILDKNKTDLGKGIQTATLAAGVALAPFTAGISLIVAPIINWLEDLFGLFSITISHYDKVRIKAADDANALVGGIGTTFQAAARTGTAADTLAALRAGQAPAGSTPNPLRTDLSLPPVLADQLGLAAQAEIENGRAIIHWADVTQEQFNALIDLFKADPSMIASSVIGKGDVSYLGQDKTHALGDQLQAGATALLTAFTAFETVRDKINQLAADILSAASDVMPPDMAQQLADYIVTPIRDGMLALLQNPDLSAEELQSQLDAMGKALQAKVESWGQFADAIQAAKLIEPMMPGELKGKMEAALRPAYDAVIAAMRTGTAEQAKIQVEAFAKQTAVWAAFGQSVTQAIDVDALLPGDLGTRFEAKMRPQYDKILATIASGNLDLAAAQVAAFNKQLAAWASIGQIVTTITGELASISGDTTPGVDAWRAIQGEMDRTVARAKVAFDAALNSGDVERIAAASAAYHDAAMARLQAESDMVKKIEDAINATLKAAATLVASVTQVAQLDIAGSGSFGTITALLGALEGMAERGSTAAQQLWAVDQALKAIVAVLPSAIAKFAPMQHAEDWLASGPQTSAQLQAGGPTQITNAVTNAAAPFLTAMQGLIDAAAGPEKLALLQQQAAQWTDLANAAIAGVNQWAQQAIQGATDAANAIIAGLAEARDAQLAAIDAQIDGIQRAAAAEHEARAAAMQALSEQIAKAKEFEAAVASMGQFISGLKLGPTAPINPRDQLTIAKDAYMSALSAYNAHPTATGLTDLQALSTAYLAADEKVYSKPAPHHIALFNLTLQQLNAAKALAAAQVTDSEVLQSQLDALQALDRDATAAAQDQIDALNDQKKSITDDFETQTKAIQDALKTQVEAIEQAAKDEIAGISAGLADALKANFEQQVPLLQAQFDAANAMVAAVGDTRVWQSESLAVLNGILRGIAIAVGQPLASGSDRVTEGLYHLHDDEAVLSKPYADALRAMGGPAALSNVRSMAGGGGYGPIGPPNQWYPENDAMASGFRVRELRHQIHDIQSMIRQHHGHASERQLTSLHILQDDLARALVAQQAPPSVPYTPPPTAPSAPPPPPPPPYVPAGPGWFNQPGATQDAAGGGALTVMVQLDGKTIGKAVLPSVLADARTGGIHTVIVETKK